MDKQQIISFIEGQLTSGRITKSDLLNLASENIKTNHPNPSVAPLTDNILVGHNTISPLPNTVSQFPNTVSPQVSTVSTKEESSRNLINTFYAIGAIIAIVGVSILIGQHWEEIGLAGRVLATLGISILSYIMALVLHKPHQKMISQVLFTIAAALAPVGAVVILQETNINFDWFVQIVISIILALIFGVALFISKKNILVLITVGFASWTYQALVIKMFGSDYYNNGLLKLAAMILGAAYILIAYGYLRNSQITDADDQKEKNSIQNVLYGFGTLAILGAGISVGGIFDLFFILFIFGAFYGSVYLRSRSMLILGGLFLMGHIIKLTARYFVGSVGWPVALIVIGFLVIGVGYLTFYLNRKFISNK